MWPSSHSLPVYVNLQLGRTATTIMLMTRQQAAAVWVVKAAVQAAAVWVVKAAVNDWCQLMSTFISNLSSSLSFSLLLLQQHVCDVQSLTTRACKSLYISSFLCAFVYIDIIFALCSKQLDSNCQTQFCSYHAFTATLISLNDGSAVHNDDL